MRVLTFAGLAVCLVGLSTGCISVVQYAPNEGLVQTKGVEDVRKQLGEVMNRSVNPHVTATEVTDEYLQYNWSEAYMGAWYQQVTTSHQNRIYFANLSRVEIYENNNVYLWWPNDQRVDKLLFASMEDAKLFVDCVSSLRAARKK